MIECDSTPIDLAFDELLRVLTSLESLSAGDAVRAGCVSELIDGVIGVMGVKRGFAKSIELLLEQMDLSYGELMRIALQQAVWLNEASWYVSKNLDDAPSNGEVMRARTLISNTLVRLDASQRGVQLDLVFPMAA